MSVNQNIYLAQQKLIFLSSFYLKTFFLSRTIYSKTIQTISFLAWLKHDRLINNRRPYTHLIVVPASTLSNWSNEFAKFAPHLHIQRYHGTPAEKFEVKRSLRKMLASNKGGKRIVDVVLTTYTMFERESGAEDRSFLKKIPFEYLVLGTIF